MRHWILLAFINYGYCGTFQQLSNKERVLTINYNEESKQNTLFSKLRHWGQYAAATYQRFEDWDHCVDCQVEDIAETKLNNTWSTLMPAFSRGYVGIHHKCKQVVVAFRGTTHIMDALSDVQIVQVPWPPSNNVGNMSRVHWGFLLAYQAAQTQIRSTLETIAEDKHLANYSLHFVGHSLGAAQATLAFVDYSLGYPKKDSTNHNFPKSCGLITFGSPRVGNLQFARLLNSLQTHFRFPQHSDENLDEENVLRVVHEYDIVPHLPRSMLLLGKYSHAGREIWARDTAGDAASEIIVCSQQVDNADGDPQCSAGTNPLKWNIFDHLVYPGIRLHTLPGFVHLPHILNL